MPAPALLGTLAFVQLMLLPAGELDRLEVLRHDDLVQVLAKENPLCVE